MEGEDAVSYTDMDIEKAIGDFSNRFIYEISLSKTITYTTKLLEFENKQINFKETVLWQS